MSPASVDDLDDVVQVDLPLRVEHAATLRVLVASLASEVGFSVDEIDDLRLAVSEVFALLTDASPLGRCVARLHVSDNLIDVLLTGPDVTAGVHLDPLASTILTSVVDEHHPLDNGVRLVKRATETSASR
ncbi:hypothetical protein [Ilumatobacter sp.]|uniref:hypothetical protein n=1 Tax=Ilumatobacter sp. TaxID=1967498 RepID=UPI003B51B70B